MPVFIGGMRYAVMKKMAQMQRHYKERGNFIWLWEIIV